MAAAAAADSVQRIKAEATCSICLELLRDPVTTACGHSFCKRCITRLCQGREDAACPQCRQPLPEGTIRRNKELRNIVASFRPQAEEKPAGGNTCEKHQEPLKLFCIDDQTPICLVCRESWAHRGHTMSPMEEAVKEYRGKMAEQLGVIKSSCGKLDQFVNEIWEHLSQNEQDEEHRNLARVSEKLRVLQVHTGTPGRRFEDKASQTEPQESPGREVSMETERQGHSGREPGSETAAETRGKMGSHTGPVGKEAPTPKYVCSQGSLDKAIHKISITTEDPEPKVDAQQTENRAEDGSSLTPAEGSGWRTDATSCSRQQEGEGAPARSQAQPPQLDPPELPPATAVALPTSTTPAAAIHPAGGAAMGGRNEAAREGQQHPGSKISKKKRRKNKKHR